MRNSDMHCVASGQSGRELMLQSAANEYCPAQVCPSGPRLEPYLMGGQVRPPLGPIIAIRLRNTIPGRGRTGIKLLG